MEPIRVLLTALPRVLSQNFARALQGLPDIELIGEANDPVAVLLAAGQARADVVVTTLHDSELSGVFSHLLSEFPQLKVLAVAIETTEAFLYELQPQRVSIGPASPDRLPEMIREAVRSGCDGARE